MDETTIVGENVAVMGSPPAGWTATWSGLSWSAVIAGAVTAIAVSFIVIALGSGIGMAVVSPYSYSSPSATTMTVIGALWLVFAQAVGFAVGGYVAGRLRRTPTPLHSDEVAFRDGASGLVVWAIGVFITAIVLVAAINKIENAAANTAIGTLAVGTAGTTALSQGPSVNYFTDTLLRSNPQGATNAAAPTNGNAAGNAAVAAGASSGTAASGSPGGAAGQAEAANGGNQQRVQINRILVTSLGPNGLSNDDRTYLAQLVAAQTGMSQPDAQKRVDTVVNQMKQDATQAAETARKAAAYVSFWTFISLLFGAVCATLGGILGGDLRDEVANRQMVTVPAR
ncbi:MAG TPA: hypothetical protein VHX43_13915 [Xanthobacteraceae bacterium]|jgi:hypothetical protein|nr:hypothetical protein [Xanthobacteraceae bacterium]